MRITAARLLAIYARCLHKSRHRAPRVGLDVARFRTSE